MDKKLFDFMHGIIGKVKEDSLCNDGISEQKLASKFYNFFVNKITNIRNMLTDSSYFVLDRVKKAGKGQVRQ